MADRILKRGAIDVNTNELTDPSQGVSKNEYKCPGCDEPVVFAKGAIVEPYFRHKKLHPSCSYFTRESQEHIEAKEIMKRSLEGRKASIRIERICRQCNQPFDCEIDPISSDARVEIEHRFVYNNGSNRYADVAVVSQNNEIEVIFEIYHTNPTPVERRPEPWFELNAREVIEASQVAVPIHLKCIRNTFVDGEVYYSTCGICNESIICADNVKGRIHFNQRGAGCGKTYESIQLLKLAEFLTKTSFIYLTKMRSATVVVYNELMGQIQKGRLGDDVKVIEDVDGKQRRVVLYVAGRQCTILIGTIDSFTHAIRDKNREYSGQNMFGKIARDIGEGIMAKNIEKTDVNYAQQKLSLTNKYLFIIDEAQDLEKAYLEAFMQVIDKTGIDAYIIGDKLQSILKQDNVFTYVENIEDERIIKNSAKNVNVVKRFHNPQFMSFVNNVVPFSKYGLPEISGICDGTCGYSHDSGADPLPPIQIEWQFPNAYQFEEPELNHQFHKIATTIRTLVSSSGYLPFNFCFIFPVVNDKTQLLSVLEPYIQNLWVDIFSDPATYTELLLENMQKHDEATKSKYWNAKCKLREDDNAFYKYIYWHRSVENQPIDLNESVHSSRILSIHSSKGTGCECVFFLGVSQKSLSFYTGGIPNTLVYDSLLHVGLTRQKKYIYVGIDSQETNMKKDIFRRFQSLKMCPEFEDATPYISHIMNYINLSKIAEEILERPLSDVDVLQLIDGDKYLRELQIQVAKSQLDWGHHVIRHAVLNVNTRKYLLTKIDQHGQQLYAMHRELTEIELQYKSYREYNEFCWNLKTDIRHNSDAKNKRKRQLKVPILIFLSNTKGGANDYDKFYRAIQSYCNAVIEKVKRRTMNFCPIESIIYCHLMDMIKNPFELKVSMMQIYEILNYYRDCYNNVNFDQQKHNDTYECKCHSHFGSSMPSILPAHSALQNSICNHYLALEKIDKIMGEYDKQVNIFVENQQIDYKICERFMLVGDITLRDSFLSWTGYSNDGRFIVSGVICPQLTTMNIHAIIMNMFLVHCLHIIAKHDSPPKILFAILHLDSDQPMFVDFEDILSNEDNLLALKQELKLQIRTVYSPYHETVYKFFDYHRNLDRSANTSELKHLYEILILEHKRLPKYITNWFKTRDEELQTAEKRRKKEIRNGIKDPKWVIGDLNRSLDYAVHTILKLRFNDDDDTDEE